MKKLFLFVLASCLLSSSAVYAAPRFGLKAGLGFSTAKVSPMSDGISKKAIMGFLVGGCVEAPLAADGSFGVRGEVAWVEKGVKFTGDNGFIKETVDELVFAPFLVYNISGLMEKARPFIQIGPEMGFVLSSNEHTEIDNQGASDKELKHVSSTDLSLNLGAGLGLPLNNKGEVVFDARYCIGLSDMDDTSQITSKLRTFFINVGYNFPPKH